MPRTEPHERSLEFRPGECFTHAAWLSVSNVRVSAKNARWHFAKHQSCKDELAQTRKKDKEFAVRRRLFSVKAIAFLVA